MTKKGDKAATRPGSLGYWLANPLACIHPLPFWLHRDELISAEPDSGSTQKRKPDTSSEMPRSVRRSPGGTEKTPF